MLLAAILPCSKGPKFTHLAKLHEIGDAASITYAVQCTFRNPQCHFAETYEYFRKGSLPISIQFRDFGIEEKPSSKDLVTPPAEQKKKENRILNVFFRKKMGGGESGLSLYNVHSLGNSRAIFHSGLNNKFLSPEKTHVRPFLLKWTGGKEDSFSRIVLLLHPLESDRNKPHSEYFWGREVFLGRHPDPHSSFYLAKKRPLLLLPRPRA